MAGEAFKIVLVGESGTGKTSIIRRYCGEPFERQPTLSLGLDCKVKNIDASGERCVLTIWDTAGQERFGSLCRSCYRGAHAIIFVYDVGSYKSFEKLDQWWADADSMLGADVVRVVCGNKSDVRRVNGMELTEDDGRAWASARGISWSECSASDNVESINTIFKNVVHEMLAVPSLRTDDSDSLLRRSSSSHRSCC